MIAGSARATEPTPISWRDDYGGALEEARATNRLVWIQFTGPWCPNCLRMERDSFPDADVIEHAQRSFVPLKLRSDVHEQLALGFNLSGLPATVWSPRTARSSRSTRAISDRTSSSRSSARGWRPGAVVSAGRRRDPARASGRASRPARPKDETQARAVRATARSA